MRDERYDDEDEDDFCDVDDIYEVKRREEK
jgi:hypothetical protein